MLPELSGARSVALKGTALRGDVVFGIQILGGFAFVASFRLEKKD
jgi:hypothetical protein